MRIAAKINALNRGPFAISQQRRIHPANLASHDDERHFKISPKTSRNHSANPTYCAIESCGINPALTPYDIKKIQRERQERKRRRTTTRDKTPGYSRITNGPTNRRSLGVQSGTTKTPVSTTTTDGACPTPWQQPRHLDVLPERLPPGKKTNNGREDRSVPQESDPGTNMFCSGIRIHFDQRVGKKNVPKMIAVTMTARVSRTWNSTKCSMTGIFIFKRLEDRICSHWFETSTRQPAFTKLMSAAIRQAGI